MYECPSDHPTLPQLFDPAIPDSPVLWAVFEGRNEGKALVDNVRKPSQCVVRTDAVLTYASRRIGQEFLIETIANFRQQGSVWLVWPPTLPAGVLVPEGGVFTKRLEFYRIDPHSRNLSDLRDCLPDGFEIRPIDRRTLKRCEWRSEMEFYCGSLDNFLVNGIGLCLMRGDEIIVEAYASSFGAGRAEIGAITRKTYRSKGYASIACAYLIQMCDRRGYQPYWSCDDENIPSRQVARKLGFQTERAYQIIEYDAFP